MISLGQAILYFKGDRSELDKTLDGAEKDTTSWAGRIGGSVSNLLTGAITGAATIAAGAVAGIGYAAVDIASQTRDATNEIQAQLGLTKEEAEGLTDVTRNIFGNNFGTSIEDANQALITTRQQMKGLADEELQGATEKALALRDVFGIDIAESTNAANTLMQEFGISADQAYDFITAGQQRGLNSSGDFLDTIGEYSTQFREGGATADQFFSQLESGLKGGMLGTDKAADTFKEFRIRITEGSDDARAALTGMGIDANQFYADMKSGNLTAADAFDQVLGKINDLDDPIARNAAGVALMGSQWEDLGAESVLAMSMQSTTMGDLAGATDSLNAKYDNFGSMWEGIKRQALLAIEPIGQKLLDFANQVMPYVSQGLEFITTLLSGEGSLGDAMGKVGGLFESAIPLVQTALGNLATGMMTWVDQNLPIWAEKLLGFGLKAVSWVGEALPGLAAELGQLFNRLSNWVVESLPEWGEKLKLLGGKLMDWVKESGPGLMRNLGEAAGSLFAWVLQTAADVVPKLLVLAGKFLGWVVTDVIPELPGVLWTIATAIYEFLAGLMDELGPKIGELAKKFYSWITDDVLPNASKGLGLVWDTISGWISDTAGKAWDAAKKIGSNIADGISGAIKSGMNTLHNIVASIINPIIEGVNNVIDGLNVVNPFEPIGRLSSMAYLASGTPSWAGGTAFASEPWLGPELARFPGGAMGLLAPGPQNIPAGTEVSNARDTAMMLRPGGGGATINMPVTIINSEIDVEMFALRVMEVIRENGG